MKCLKNATEHIQKSSQCEKSFILFVKRLKAAYDVCNGSEIFKRAEKDYIYLYLAIKSILLKITRGNAPDITQMNIKVKKLIEESISSDGVKKIYTLNESYSELNIFDEKYLFKISKIKQPNTKIKLLHQLLLRGINDFKKLNKPKGIDFSKKFTKIVDKYNERKEQDTLRSEVLDDFADEIIDLYNKLKEETKAHKKLGIDIQEKAFFDILKNLTLKYDFAYPDENIIELAKEVKICVDHKTKYTDWNNRDDIKSELKAELIILLAKYNYPPIDRDEIFKEILEQAENFGTSSSQILQ